MNKSDTVKIIIDVCRSEHSDEEVTEMVSRLIDQISQPADAPSTFSRMGGSRPRGNKQLRAYGPGKARFLALTLATTSERTLLTDFADTLYGGHSPDQQDNARAIVNKLVRSGYMVRDGFLYRISDTGRERLVWMSAVHSTEAT